MFTGIVTDLGRLRQVARPPQGGTDDRRLVIETGYDLAGLEIGASVACSGVCLTVVEKGEGAFAIDVSAETLSKTTIGEWGEGQHINLERALRLGDELGGHLVSGHVDGLARCVESRPEGWSQRFRFEVPRELARFVAAKGSVALDGVSLTVNAVEGTAFDVNVIPHTAKVTTFGELTPGRDVNFEIDTVARYLARLTEFSA